MNPGCRFPPTSIKRLHDVCSQEPRLAALYAFGLRRDQDCNLAALFTSTPTWPDRLDLELSIGAALGLEGAELADLQRVPLVSRYGIVKEGELLYVGQADVLAVFIEHTVARYLSLYPLLEALYWKVETGPLSEDKE